LAIAGRLDDDLVHPSADLTNGLVVIKPTAPRVDAQLYDFPQFLAPGGLQRCTADRRLCARFFCHLSVSHGVVQSLT
jgi:hypothetical protein